MNATTAPYRLYGQEISYFSAKVRCALRYKRLWFGEIHSDFPEIVRRTVPGSRVEFADGAGPDARCYRVDFTKIERQITSFAPRWTAPKGAAQLYETYRATGLAVEDFEGARYKRVEHVRQLMQRGLLDAQYRWCTPSEHLAQSRG